MKPAQATSLLDQLKASNYDDEIMEMFSAPVIATKKPQVEQTPEQQTLATETQEDSDEELENHQAPKPRAISDSKEEQAPRTLFLGNIPVAMTRKELLKLAKPYGPVESVRFRSIPLKKTLSDNHLLRRVSAITGDYNPDAKAKTAYIVYQSEESTVAALALHNQTIDGLIIRANRASEKKEKKHCVFVGNLPFDMDDEDVRAHFATCGEIDEMAVVRGRDGSSKGIAWVNFALRDSMKAALQMNEVSQVDGRILRVYRYKEQTGEKKEKTQTKGKETKPRQKPREARGATRVSPQQGEKRKRPQMKLDAEKKGVKRYPIHKKRAPIKPEFQKKAKQELTL